MQLVLNLAWMMLAALMAWLWLHHAASEGVGRWAQFVALATVILILLPVISVTDDLMMAQNPAETERFQRNDQLCAIAHSTHYPVADLPPQFFAKSSFDQFRFAALDHLLAPPLKVPATDTILNRPPPASLSFHRFC